MKITETVVGLLNGQIIKVYHLINDRSLQVDVLSYGATLMKILMPDRLGHVENIIVGFDKWESYIDHIAYFGASVGPVAGRINKGGWGEVQLTKNVGNVHMHGGIRAFSHRPWELFRAECAEDAVTLTLELTLEDGVNGYPGPVCTTVTFQLTNDNELILSYTGLADQRTLFNPTSHTYFNLSGDIKSLVDQHILTIHADKVTELDTSLCPTGQMLDVTGTAFDFRYGQVLNDFFKKMPNGLDTPFLLDRRGRWDIALEDRVSGRRVRIETGCQSVVVFTSNGMDEDYIVNGKRKMAAHLGVAIEPQMLPDAVRHTHFGSIIIEPGEIKQYRTLYQFQTLH